MKLDKGRVISEDNACDRSGPRGFHLIDVLPNGSKFDAEQDISHILSPLREILALYQDDPRRHFMI
jgi:hypothetical protein